MVTINGHQLLIIVDWSVGAKLHSSTKPENEGGELFFRNIINSIREYVSIFGQLPPTDMYFNHNEIDVKINYMSFDYKKKIINFNIS